MKIQQNMSLAEVMYYHIGGKAKLVLEAMTVSDVAQAVKELQHRRITDFSILGMGANVVLPDQDLPAVLWIHNGEEQIRLIEEDKIEVFAGEILDEVVKFAFAQNLAGLGWAGGLPSSIGGAVRGNAGCFGAEIKDIISSVDCIDRTDPEAKIQSFTNSECQFGYRESLFKHNQNLIIAAATLQLHNASIAELKKDEEAYQNNIAYRQTHHPIEYPSCGSIFKNIVKSEDVARVSAAWPEVKELSDKKWHGKIAMAYVIGKLGFSGYQIGDAQVSEKHNNYISNLGQAKANEVKKIIQLIKQKFIVTFGFEPELEVELIKLSH